jgi:hypothetical protein
MEHRLGELRRPYQQSAAKKWDRVAHASILAGSGLLLRRGANSRRDGALAGALLCAGALSVRWNIFKAGIQSARDPAQVIGPQRAAIARGERRGGARRTARVSAPDPAIGSPATAELARG